MSDQPRNHPRNLQGLLKFCLEATKAEDTTLPSQFHEMSDEDRKFLEDALKSMTIDVVEELNKAFHVLTSENASEDSQISALDVITSFVSDIDTANDFFKIGGFSIIIPCLNSAYAEVRSGTALLIGELAQNNELCQHQLLNLNILPKLIELVSKDDPNVSSSALHAVSCLSRNYDTGMEEFISMGGLECLISLTENKESSKLAIKSLFLISAYVQESEKVREQLVKLNAVEKISANVEFKGEYNTHLEQSLAALVNLTKCSEAIKRLQNMNIGLSEKLDQIISSCKNKDECQELIDYSRTLKKRVFKQ